MKETWIEQGYNTFALKGPESLKIERLASEVNKNKSSFYHYFADLEIFTSRLLELHLNRARIMGQKEANCTSLDDLIEVMVEHKIDLLFNRQLRVHRTIERFRKCFVKTTEITEPSIMGVWAELLDLKHQSYLAKLVLKLGTDNFYLQITEENLNADWLRDYFGEFRRLVNGFKTAQSPSLLDGTV